MSAEPSTEPSRWTLGSVSNALAVIVVAVTALFWLFSSPLQAEQAARSYADELLRKHEHRPHEGAATTEDLLRVEKRLERMDGKLDRMLEKL